MTKSETSLLEIKTDQADGKSKLYNNCCITGDFKTMPNFQLAWQRACIRANDKHTVKFSRST